MDSRTALIVIDMQNGFLSPASPQYIAGAAATVPACATVIQSCRERGIPVFFVTRLYRADGSDVEHTRFHSWLDGGKPLSPGCPEAISAAMPEAFGVCEGDYLVYKPRFSAFFQTPVDLMLRRLGRDTVLLAGTTTPNCIRTTAYDGISLEYNVAVLSDCTSSVSEAVQRANLEDMARVGIQILSSDDFLSRRVPLTDCAGQVQARVKAGI
ncbi:MAG: cysteine hydrolase [Oscillospiraceae bacterium]|nr:cysteine hydrolase [Oscillospiraceae bacterium]